jgi:hypothetical protein
LSVQFDPIVELQAVRSLQLQRHCFVILNVSELSSFTPIEIVQNVLGLRCDFNQASLPFDMTMKE